MNNEQLDRLKAISGEDSNLYQLASKNASQSLETGEKVRCNNCMLVQDENIKVCKECKTDEYLMQPFIDSDIVDGSEPYGHDKMERLEYMQERADEFRKDDSTPSEPEWNE